MGALFGEHHGTEICVDPAAGVRRMRKGADCVSVRKELKFEILKF